MPGRTEWIHDLRHDVRYGLRMLAKQPLSTVLVLLTLALGIGAGSAIFSAVRGTLLQELPYLDSDELVMVWMDNTRLEIRTDIASYPNYADTRDGSATLADLAVYRPTWATLTGTGASLGRARSRERLAVRTASRLALAPSSCPPMPSATVYSAVPSGCTVRQAQLSSLA